MVKFLHKLRNLLINKKKFDTKNTDVSRSIGGDPGNSSSNVVSLTPRIKKSVISDDNNGAVGNPDMITCEILSRLPVKSLMRFKCVSKTWLSLIEDDPYFAALHFERSKACPAILMVVPLTRDLFMILTANQSRDRSRAEICSIGMAKSFNCTVIPQPVDGLFCFVDRTKCDVRVYNISTREVTPCVRSPLQESSSSCLKAYEFGFDPITKKHKVLCVCLPTNRNQYKFCEVLTIGDNAWRRIENPPCDLSWSSVYVNGSIYYCTSESDSGNWDNNGAVLVAFDVGSEKFKTIRIPNLILSNRPSGRFVIVNLLEVDGHVAIACRISANIFKLWVYREDTDYVHNKTKTTTSGNYEENWTEETTFFFGH